jgi:16S rRNA (uracil1498-N3)-methyltransferase
MSRRYHVTPLPSPGERIELPRETSHHILQVCRHPRGEPLLLFDGQGREHRCALVDVRGQRAVVEGLEALPVAPPPPPIALLLALCKPTAWETAVRMATELGISDLQPVLATRSTVRRLRIERWLKLVVAACEQSGRRWLPRLHEPLPLPSALEAPWLPQRRLLLAPGAPSDRESTSGGMALLVGPEGGLSDEEQAQARQAGFEPTGLSSHVLRVDTAVAAALARYGA